jgi:hypothetical protein
MRRISSQIIIATLIASSALLLTACDGVIDKSEDEIVGKLGKPEAVEKIGDDGVRYVYRRKTFDPDNYNQIDERTIIDFEKKAGKMIVVDVSFG